MKTSAPVKSATGAVSRGDCAVLRRMLNEYPELVEDPRLLNAAALFGQDQAASLLLSAGAEVDGQVRSHEKYRPLHRAIEHRGYPRNDGHAKVVALLLDAGASLTARSTWMDLTPLAVAGQAGEEDCVRLLLSRKAPMDVFHAAVLADQVRVEKFLRKSPSLAMARDENDMTVLHYAALCRLNGKESEMRGIAGLLLDAGADGNAVGAIGPYPPTPVLHFGAWGNFALCEELLKRGCDPNHGFGNCLWQKPGPMAELFRAHGADVCGRDHSGTPHLNSRIHWNLPSTALWLLEHGADANATDAQGNTPLHEAAIRGINLEVVDALLASGARRTATNKAGLTALDLAIERKREKIVARLKKK